MNKEQILERLYQQNIEVQDKLGERGLVYGEDYFIDSISLQGSQNYGTDHEGSDVDSKIIIIPSVESMLRGITLSADYSVSNNEKVSVKTFPDFVNLFFKGNVNNLEMLYTEYIVGNDGLLSKIRHLREDIVQATRKTVTDAVIGMQLQKLKSLHKGTETTQPFVEKYGYDGKDCLHIFRLSILLDNLRTGSTMGEALKLSAIEKETARAIREGKFSKEFVDEWTQELIDSSKRMEKMCLFENDNEKIAYLRAIIQDIYVQHYKENFL